MSFDKQVSETCQAGYFHICALRHIRASLTIYWGFQNHSCSNRCLPIWFLQFSPGWHIRFKSGSPSTCPEHSCSGSRTKTSVLPHHTLFSLICIGFRYATELALKSLRLLTGCYNFSSPPIVLLSSRDINRREHSALLHLCQCVFPHVKPPWQPPNHLHCCGYLECTAWWIHWWICRPSQLFLFLEELSNILYSCLLTLTVVQNLVWSNQLNVSHFVIQCQLLPSHSPWITCHPSNSVLSERLRLVKRFILHGLYILAHGEILCYLLTYLLTYVNKHVGGVN